MWKSKGSLPTPPTVVERLKPIALSVTCASKVERPRPKVKCLLLISSFSSHPTVVKSLNSLLLTPLASHGAVVERLDGPPLVGDRPLCLGFNNSGKASTIMDVWNRSKWSGAISESEIRNSDDIVLFPTIPIIKGSCSLSTGAPQPPEQESHCCSWYQAKPKWK